MRVNFSHIGSRPRRGDAFDELVGEYVSRCAAYAECAAQAFSSEQAFLEWLERQEGRTPAIPVLFDSRGKQLASESFAAWLGAQRDAGGQHMVFAIGPASGWSDAARSRARLLVSLGAWTLPHALARVVVAEQVYRAFTILSGHPYHTGH